MIHGNRLLLLLASVLLCAAIVLPAPTAAAPSDAPGDALRAVDLRVCDKQDPVGVQGTPWFGWRALAETRAALQSGYRIQVASTLALLQAGEPDVWDSGLVASVAVNAIRYAGPALSADTRYYWRVLLADDRGVNGPPSEVARFDVGLLGNQDWAGARWIRRESSEEDDYTFYRKSFELEAGEILHAVIHISSCHKYELWANGAAVGKGPAYHQPQYQYYNSYDIASLLRPGAVNSIAVFNHWWGAGQGRPRGARGMIAHLTVLYTDGRKMTLGSDGTWRQQRGEQWELGMPKRNRTNGIGFVEKMHGERIIAGWQETAFDDRGWQQASVVGPQPTAPWTGVLQPDLTRVVEERHDPVSWTKLGDNHYLVDFGRVQAGYPMVDFPASAVPAEVTLRGGYTLEEDGRVSTRTAQKTDLSYIFVHDGRARQFRPCEYLGMRYVEIQNAPAGLQSANVHFVSRHYELATARGAGVTFESSNPMLDRVWRLMVDSIPVGTHEQFIDTPTREKGGFLNDAWSESVAAMLALGDRTMTRRVLEEYLDSQDSFWGDEGRLNDVYPYDNKDDIPDYTQAYLLWVWDYYRETGDTAFLAENYDKLAKIAAYVLRSRDAATGLIRNLEGGDGDYLHGIIDWPKSMRYGYDMDTAARTVINAYAWEDLKVMARIARVLGREKDAVNYDRDAVELGAAINQRLVDGDGVYSDGLKPDGTLSTHFSQQASMLPLAFGLVPTERRAAALNHVKSLRMSSGMVTVRMLVEAIGASGDGAHLVELFTNDTWDGWAKSLARGATCTWESWNAIDGNESLSHAWGAIGLVGYVRYILGVEPIEAQHARVRVRPLEFGESLARASGTVPTDRGNVRVGWQRVDDTCFRLELELPDAMRAEVWIPRGAATALRCDGVEVDARRSGAYLIVDVGPGVHLFETR